MNKFDELRNAAERQAEKNYPGYKGNIYGMTTPDSKTPRILPRRTQVSVSYKDQYSTYWLDMPEGSFMVGDEIWIAERAELLTVTHVGTTLSGDYFLRPNPIPHKFGTFVHLESRRHD